MTKMRKDRLKILADFLKTVPEERFVMNEWVKHDTGKMVTVGGVQFALVTVSDNLLRNGIIATPLELCGTTGCAAGWAASIPAFRRDGFHIDQDFVPKYKDKTQLQACMDFFGLRIDQADYIFVPTLAKDVGSVSNLTTAQVIKRIHAVIRNPKRRWRNDE